jgi:hypothetical protein
MKRVILIAGAIVLGMGQVVALAAERAGGGGAAGRGAEARQRFAEAWDKVNKADCFAALDADGNGSVSKEEFEAANLREVFGPALRKAMAETAGAPAARGEAGNANAFESMDRNQDGKLTADEFPKGKEAFERLLQHADKDGDGTLSKEEMKAALMARERPPAAGGAGGRGGKAGPDAVR